MKTKVALVGLPNTGKSTLFNAIAQQSIAESANYPFCTIEPNTTPIPIPDDNLPKLATLANSKKALNAKIFLVDVAGLVKGASRGEGLGNRFLATVRECDLIIHVVRSYIDEDVIHVDGKVDPVADAEVVNMELLLADLAHVQRRLERSTCIGDERGVLLKVEKGLKEGFPARSIGLSPEEALTIKSMGLLTLKPVVYAFNVDEVDFTMNKQEALRAAEECMRQIQYCDLKTDAFTVVSAKLECELGLLGLEDRNAYMESISIDDSAPSSGYVEQLSYHTLPLLVKDVLGLSLVYTGPAVPPERSQTTKAHLISSSGTTASDLAGKLHSEIQKGFICADVTNVTELVQYESYNAAKENGVVRMEGKQYVLMDGDVIYVRWN